MSYILSAFAGSGAQFFDDDGAPLSGGLIYTYAAGTTTPVTTYTTSSGSTPNSNPIVLDAAGRTTEQIWVVSGSLYKFIVRTSLGVLVGEPNDNIPGIDDPTVPNNLITVTGTNTLIGTSPTPITGYTLGATYSFVPPNTNTGAVTIDIDEQGAKEINYDATTDLGAGALQADKVAVIQYDGVGFQLVNSVLINQIPPDTRIDVASATNVNLTTSAPNNRNIKITGTTPITGFTVTTGLLYDVVFEGVLTLTNGAGLVTNTGANITTVAGASCAIRSTAANTVEVLYYSTGPVVTTAQIQPISASVGSNALTISASALSLGFRSSTLGSGTVTTVLGTPANLVISSGSTLGTVNAVQSDIVVIALNNAGTIELAAVNIAGGTQLDETNLLTTTSEGGAGGADSASTVYSTTARTNVAYRVLGIIRSTQATAGTWATAPSLIQGSGGNSLTSMASIGYGQTWQSVTRTSGTTYYNTTGKPIFICVNNTAGTSATSTVVVNGVTAATWVVNAGAIQIPVTILIPPNASYVVTIGAGGSHTTTELR